MSKLKIGWASGDISTDKPVMIPGQMFMRVSKGVHDPLTFTVFVADEGDSVIFVSLDYVEFTDIQLDMVRSKVAEKNSDIPLQNVIMSSTHTHAGGPNMLDKDVYGTADNDEKMPVNLDVASSDEYLDFMTDAVADGICRAWASRKECGVAYGYGYAVVGHSRRVVYFDDVSKRPGRANGNAVESTTSIMDGHAVMYGNTDDDNFSHYEAGADHFINLLYTFDESGKLTGAIVNVPCPSQNSEMSWMLSASYWNEVRELIRAKYGDIFILPQCAAAGDLAPRILHYLKAQARRLKLKFGEDEDIEELNIRRDIAERISEAFDEVLSWAKKDIHTSMPIRHEVSQIMLPRFAIWDEAYEMACKEYAAMQQMKYVSDPDPVKEFQENTTIAIMRMEMKSIKEEYESLQTVKAFPHETHTIGMGDIAFTTNAFELYMDYQHRIQARSPYEQTFMVQLCAQPKECAGCFGYLCTERAAVSRGYSAIPMVCKISPEGGQKYVEYTVETLKKLHE